MLSDIKIAQQASMQPIADIAAGLGIDESYIEPYGKYKCKLDHALYRSLSGRPDGKLILVTAINPTPAGEGKTTTSVGLGEAMKQIGKAADMHRSSRWRISICILPAICTLLPLLITCCPL